jgi:putative transposase
MGNPIPLKAGCCYHIFNRGNNRENLFVQERNYAYFLRLWGKYITPIADTYAYCLLRNHFHAAVHIKNSQDLSGLLISRHFSNLFNAYARAFNLATGRTGALFERPFERILVGDENYLARLIIYIHQNPQKHAFVQDFREWPHSSYRELLATDASWLRRDEVMALFGGVQTFLELHQEIRPFRDMEDEG